METQKENGELNNLIVHRLKDKLGTKALPTAEVFFENLFFYLLLIFF